MDEIDISFEKVEESPTTEKYKPKINNEQISYKKFLLLLRENLQFRESFRNILNVSLL